MTYIFPVGNLLGAVCRDDYSLDGALLERIQKAQTDHVSTGFMPGVVRIIMQDVGRYVEPNYSAVGVADVRDHSYTQWLATMIAHEYNLQCYLWLRNSRYDLVVVSQLDGPLDNCDRLGKRLEEMKIC